MATHEFIKELTESGLTEHQSETIARHQSLIINENLATKQDVESLKRDIELVKHDIESLRHELKQDIESLRQEFKQNIESLRHELIVKLGIMLIGGWVAAIGIILGVMSVMLK